MVDWRKLVGRGEVWHENRALNDKHLEESWLVEARSSLDDDALKDRKLHWKLVARGEVFAWGWYFEL